MTDNNNNNNPLDMDVIVLFYSEHEDTAGAAYDDAVEAYWEAYNELDYEEWAADFYYEEPVPDYVVYYPSE
jgi:hypothetical protein